MKTHFVHCEWDDDAKVWFVAHSTVPGLATEATGPDDMLAKLEAELACGDRVAGQDDAVALQSART